MPPPPWLVANSNDGIHFHFGGAVGAFVVVTSSGLFAGASVVPAMELLAEAQYLSEGASANLTMLLIQVFATITTAIVDVFAAPAMHLLLLFSSVACLGITACVREDYARLDSLDGGHHLVSAHVAGAAVSPSDASGHSGQDGVSTLRVSRGTSRVSFADDPDHEGAPEGESEGVGRSRLVSFQDVACPLAADATASDSPSPDFSRGVSASAGVHAMGSSDRSAPDVPVYDAMKVGGGGDGVVRGVEDGTAACDQEAAGLETEPTIAREDQTAPAPQAHHASNVYAPLAAPADAAPAAC